MPCYIVHVMYHNTLIQIVCLLYPIRNSNVDMCDDIGSHLGPFIEQ